MFEYANDSFIRANDFCHRRNGNAVFGAERAEKVRVMFNFVQIGANLRVLCHSIGLSES